MSLYLIISIMAITGIFGGIVNFHSDANIQKESENTKAKKLRHWGVCILFGIAATVLVPLFLKFADSKLLQEIYIPEIGCKKEQKTQGKVPQTATFTSVKADSIKSTLPNNTSTQPGSAKPVAQKAEEKFLAENYLIWTAYCLLAACAGMRFIDLLINKFLTEAQVIKLEKEKKEEKTKNNKLEAEKNVLEVKVENTVKLEEKRKKNLEISEQNKVEKLNVGVLEMMAENQVKYENLPELPPIKFADDPQKGRFKGKSKSNDRTLSVSYQPYFLSGYLKLTIKVSADKQNDPLKGNVYLFLHDSFVDSMVVCPADGKPEVTHEVISYGAFTIGAVTDEGETMLELDIAEQENFPKDFRNR